VKKGKGKSRARDDGTLPLPGFSKYVQRKKAPTPKITWLTPYFQHYRDAYGESPSPVAASRMARAFKSLEESHGPESARRFQNYVHSTPVHFYSAERFAETFPAWIHTQPGRAQNPAEPLPGEDVDTYIQRQASRK